MLAVQKPLIAWGWPERSRARWSTSHCRILQLSSESPRSHGMSRARPSASGHVKTRAMRRYSAAAVLARKESFVEFADQIPDLVQLRWRGQKHHPEVTLAGAHAESGAVHAQHTCG